MFQVKEYGQRTTVVLGFMLPPKIWVPIVLQRLQEVVSHAHIQGKLKGVSHAHIQGIHFYLKRWLIATWGPNRLVCLKALYRYHLLQTTNP